MSKTWLITLWPDVLSQTWSFLFTETTSANVSSNEQLFAFPLWKLLSCKCIKINDCKNSFHMTKASSFHHSLINVKDPHQKTKIIILFAVIEFGFLLIIQYNDFPLVLRVISVIWSLIYLNLSSKLNITNNKRKKTAFLRFYYGFCFVSFFFVVRFNLFQKMCNKMCETSSNAMRKCVWNMKYF